MRFEFEEACAHLAPGGVLASHDVRLSTLFSKFAAERGMSSTVVCDTGIARTDGGDEVGTGGERHRHRDGE